MNLEFEENLVALLKQRRAIDVEIGKLFALSNSGIRFSEKEFVGDLGEYYFYKFAPSFLKLEQSTTSNSNCDFIGELTIAGKQIFGLDLDRIRIEVKTRHAQVGNNHLFSIDNSKFDLLAFVALADDFSCRYIGTIRGKDIAVDKQNRIKFSDYHRQGLVRWQTLEWTEL